MLPSDVRNKTFSITIQYLTFCPITTQHHFVVQHRNSFVVWGCTVLLLCHPLVRCRLCESPTKQTAAQTNKLLSDKCDPSFLPFHQRAAEWLCVSSVVYLRLALLSDIWRHLEYSVKSLWHKFWIFYSVNTRAEVFSGRHLNGCRVCDHCSPLRRQTISHFVDFCLK